MPLKLFGFHDAIRAEVASHPDAILAELRRWLGEVHGISAGDGLMRGTLAKLGLTHKRTLHAAELVETRSVCCWERLDVVAARGRWREQQPSLTPGRLLFLDKTSVQANTVQDYGWAPRRERLVASVPHGHRKTSTFTGYLHQGRIIASYVLDGAVNGERFAADIE